MKVERQRNGNVVITLGVNETVTVRGEDIHVSLDSADNTYNTPKLATDVDAVIVTGRRRNPADYPPDDEPM